MSNPLPLIRCFVPDEWHDERYHLISMIAKDSTRLATGWTYLEKNQHKIDDGDGDLRIISRLIIGVSISVRTTLARVVCFFVVRSPYVPEKYCRCVRLCWAQENVILSAWLLFFSPFLREEKKRRREARENTPKQSHQAWPIVESRRKAVSRRPCAHTAYYRLLFFS